MNCAAISSSAAGGNSQNDRLFIRGNAMSGAPIMSGTNQLPKPPMRAGMTMKKIMITPWDVMNTLYMCLAASGDPSPARMLEIQGNTPTPVPCNSMRIAIDIAAPMRPAKTAKYR